MKKYLLILLLICFSSVRTIATEIAEVDTLVQISCQLKDEATLKPIAYAHIINPGLNVAVITDTLGFFSTVMRRTDTLLITSIGYVATFFTLPRFWPSNYYKGTIFAGEKLYPIREVSVTSFGNYQQFKNKVVHYNPPEPPIEKVQKEIQSVSRTEAVQWDKVRVGLNFSMKSKEERSLAKLKFLLEEQEKQKIIDSKFNKKNVGELTGLKGQELDAFMRYCYIPEDFILSASEYDVLVLVKNLYRQYRSSKKKKPESIFYHE